MEGQVVGRVQRQAQQGQRVADLLAFEEAQPLEDAEGDALLENSVSRARDWELMR